MRSFHCAWLSRPGLPAVAVAYADHISADAPTSAEVAEFAITHRAAAFLIDTWAKDGSTLLDHIAVAELRRLCDRLRSAGVRVALAGSLGEDEIGKLRHLNPDWFAVRGAACDGGRGGVIDASRVRRLGECAGQSSELIQPC